MLICLDPRTNIGCRAKNPNGTTRCQVCGRSLRFVLQLHDPNDVIRNYVIKRLIGYGSFGAVYEAEDTSLPWVQVALKETFIPDTIRQFRREFDILKDQTHLNLPCYFEMFVEGEFEEVGYMVMEFVPGQSLEDVLYSQHSPLLETQVLGYAIQICDVLHHLHSHTPPIIHRDIKPANIRITPEGVIKLVDFGLVKVGTQQKVSTIRGATPAYGPYEQFGSGGADQRSDVYSLGATIYHLLTAQEPIAALDRLNVSPDPLVLPHRLNPTLSHGVSYAIMRAMAVFQRDRYQDILAFKHALLGIPNVSDRYDGAVCDVFLSEHDTQHHATEFPISCDTTRYVMPLNNTTFGDNNGYWCYIPAGMYRVGGWATNQLSSAIYLDEYWIAQYPVTVADYQPFVAVGYQDDAEHWWTPLGWQWKQDTGCMQPGKWDDPDYTSPHQPVIGLSWYEAVAFAAWLTEQLADELPAGYVIRLPTEAEWEVAASYEQPERRRRYPWGNNPPTTAHAIYDESGFITTAPVGSCPSGVAACGAYDMVGNVWEWTVSSYSQYPEASNITHDDFASTDWDVSLRGGAWDNNRIHIACSARFWAKPGNWNQYWGVRLVWAPHSIHTGDDEQDANDEDTEW